MKDWQAPRRWNMKRLLTAATLTAMLATMVVLPGVALAASGDAPKPVACTFVSEATGLIYEGSGQVVSTPGGNVASCAGPLIPGQTPVTQVTRSTFTWGTSDQECSVIEFTTGHFRFICAN